MDQTTQDVTIVPPAQAYVPRETRIQQELSALGVTAITANYARGVTDHDLHIVALHAEGLPIPNALYDDIEHHVLSRLNELDHSGVLTIDVGTMTPQNAVTRTRKDAMLDTLVAWGVSKVTARYDGADDNGYIDTIEANITLTQAQTDEIDAFVWACLNTHCSGFEINSGGCGDVVIDATARTVQIQHNTYVTTTEYEEVDV